MLYVLDKHGTPVAVTIDEWVSKLRKRFTKGQAAERVGHTQVGRSLISTVFLGIDHNYHQSGPPILWETMVFGGPLDTNCYRCAGTREQAEAMHARVVKLVKASKRKKANAT
jgi:hypothetical protein